MAYSPTYVTAANCKAFTSDADLAAEDDALFTAEFGFIHKAEVQIDRFCGYWDRYAGKTQTRVFPRTTDVDSAGDTFIPEPIKMATMAQVEYNYLNKPDMDHGIEEDEKPKRKEIISPRAMQYLKGYVMKGGRITMSPANDPRHFQ